jgi:hypothetical protein
MYKQKIAFLTLIALLLILQAPRYSFLSTNPSFAPFNSSYEEVQLAGQAVFPEKEHHEWLEVQQNLNLGAEEKIKSTVNTFFILTYEGRTRRALQDFGFLFDLDDINAYDDYAYERGLRFLEITGERYYNIHLQHYVYLPDFERIEISDKEATVEIQPNAEIVYSDTPNRVDPGGYFKYSFTVVLKEGSWLIRDARCNSIDHQSVPRGIDFNEKAKDVIETNLELEEKKLTATKQRERKDKRIKMYTKITGEYRFDNQNKTLSLSFFIRNNVLYGCCILKQEEFALYPIRNKELEFFAILDNGEILDFRFFREPGKKIHKCLMKTRGIEVEGIKN